MPWVLRTPLLAIALVLLGVGACRPTPRVERGKPKLVRQIRARGLDYTARAFREQAREGNLENVRLFLQAGMDPDIRRHWRANLALYEACRAGHPEVVALLLEHGADVDRRGPHQERTALMVAAERGHPEVTRLLLKHGADPDLRNSKGEGALDLAREHRREEVVALLVSRAARR